MPTLDLHEVLARDSEIGTPNEPFLRRDCHFVDVDGPVETAFYQLEDQPIGARIAGPAVVLSPATTFLVEPGWHLTIGRYGSGLLERSDATPSH